MQTHALKYSSWGDSLYWLGRFKLTSQIRLLFAVLLLVAAPFVLPSLFPNYSATLAFDGAIALGIYLLVSQYFSERLRKSFDAKTRAYRHVATPFTSMFSTLLDQGATLAKITRLTVETGKFSNLFHYLNGDGKVLMDLLSKNPSAQIHVYGLNDLSDGLEEIRGALIDLSSPTTTIHFHDTKKLAITHRNVVRVNDGRFFLWFEEHHEIENGHHYFPRGAFLFEVDERTAARVEAEVASGIPFKAGVAHAA